MPKDNLRIGKMHQWPWQNVRMSCCWNKNALGCHAKFRWWTWQTLPAIYKYVSIVMLSLLAFDLIWIYFSLLANLPRVFFEKYLKWLMVINIFLNTFSVKSINWQILQSLPDLYGRQNYLQSMFNSVYLGVLHRSSWYA